MYDGAQQELPGSVVTLSTPRTRARHRLREESKLTQSWQCRTTFLGRAMSSPDMLTYN